jgi:peptidoglycan/LPS O-acetylase OafA/YrhL
VTRATDPESAPGFRPEIHALRALAVALVVVFHVWPGVVPGGYVGVDVFFVVSGFLITRHLVAEVRRTGTIGLTAFWARRIRRLLPAASVVLVFSFTAMLAVVPRSLWERTVTEIGASALSLQNWVLAAGSVDYLGAEGTPTLVQHYWSLALEEQFYVVWPVLIVGACLVARTARVRGITVVLTAVVVASLAYSIALTSSNQPVAYFDTAARAWEFGAGALLALAPLAAVERIPHAVRSMAGATGAALIVLSAVLFSADTPFPGPWAVVPVLATLLVIAAGRAGRVATAPPVRWLGSISYPLYLWHWPLIVLVPYVGGAPVDGPAGAVVVAMALALAWSTSRLVERPLRTARRGRARAQYLLAAGVTAVLLTGAGVTTSAVQAGSASAAEAALTRFATDPCYGAAAMVAEQDCGDRFAVPPGLDTAFAAQDKGSLAQPCSATGTTVVRCAFGETRHPVRTLVVVGNSHAGHLVAGLEAFGATHGWRVELMRKTGCTGTSTLELTESGCREWTEAVLGELVDRDDVDVVALATNDDSLRYLGPDDATEAQLDAIRAGISDNLAALVAAGRTVVAVGDVPGMPAPAPECVYLHRGEYDPCSTPREAESGNLVAEAARATSGVGFVDLDPWFCDDDTCHAVIGGAVVYLDEHHLTAAFSRSLGPFLGAEIARHLPG